MVVPVATASMTAPNSMITASCTTPYTVCILEYVQGNKNRVQADMLLVGLLLATHIG